jgi:peptidase G2-like protein
MTNTKYCSVRLRGLMWAACVLVAGFLLYLPSTAVAQVSGGGTAGKIPKWTGSSTIEDSVITESSGSVGIGTANPGRLLEISGNLNPGIKITNSSAQNGAFLLYTRNDNGTLAGRQFVIFDENAFADRFAINSSGNVGIGTINPASKLEVIGNMALSPNNRITSTADWSNYFMPYESSTGRMVFRTGAVDRVSILYSGNVGIGTTNPAAKLDVGGNTNVAGNLTVVGTGNITANGTISGGNIIAKYQDIAEWVPTSQTLISGTVVVLDVQVHNRVVASHTAYDTRVAGVISDTPGVILGEAGEGKVKVATTGRVRVKVDATRAPIRVGDLLVTSDKEGLAMRSKPLSLGGTPIHRPGTLIGKALEALDEGVGEILVLLSLQ